MDPETLKVLLDSQERAFRAATDTIIEQMKGRTATLESRVEDLIKSLEFTQTEVQDLKNELKSLQKTDRENRNLIEDYKIRIEDLEQRANYQEDYNRRPNLRFSGVPELCTGETLEETATLVQKIIINNLKLPSMDLVRAHRVGPLDPSRPRAIVARFEKFSDRETVLRNARKLKESGIFINEDLCSASQALRAAQLPQLKQARKDGKIAFFKYTKLIIKDRPVQRNSGTASTSHLSITTTTATTTITTTASETPIQRTNNAASMSHPPPPTTTALVSTERNNDKHAATPTPTTTTASMTTEGTTASLVFVGAAAVMTPASARGPSHSRGDGGGTATPMGEGVNTSGTTTSRHSRTGRTSNYSERLRDRKNNTKK